MRVNGKSGFEFQTKRWRRGQRKTLYYDFSEATPELPPVPKPKRSKVQNLDERAYYFVATLDPGGWYQFPSGDRIGLGPYPRKIIFQGNVFEVTDDRKVVMYALQDESDYSDGTIMYADGSVSLSLPKMPESDAVLSRLEEQKLKIQDLIVEADQNGTPVSEMGNLLKLYQQTTREISDRVQLLSQPSKLNLNPWDIWEQTFSYGKIEVIGIDADGNPVPPTPVGNQAAAQQSQVEITEDGLDSYRYMFDVMAGTPLYSKPRSVVRESDSSIRPATPEEVKKLGVQKENRGLKEITTEQLARIYGKLEQGKREKLEQNWFREWYEKEYKSEWPRLSSEVETVKQQRAINEEELKRIEASKLDYLRKKQAEVLEAARVAENEQAQAERSARILRIAGVDAATVKLYVCVQCLGLTDKWYGFEADAKLCILCWDARNRNSVLSQREQFVIVVYPDGSQKRMQLTGGVAKVVEKREHSVLAKGRKIRKS